MGLFKRLFGKKQQSPGTIELTKVFPRIKALYDDETIDPNPSGTPIDITGGDKLIHEPITKGLAIFYAIDQGNVFQLIQLKQLSTRITLKQLRDAALKNLTEATLDSIELRGDPANFLMLTNGGNYEATMILLDKIWMELEHLFDDQVCIAIPARDLLFISGKNNLVGRESLRSLVCKAFNEEDIRSLLVRHIYTREDNQWIYLETV